MFSQINEAALKCSKRQDFCEYEKFTCKVLVNDFLGILKKYFRQRIFDEPTEYTPLNHELGDERPGGFNFQPNQAENAQADEPAPANRDQPNNNNNNQQAQEIL